MHDNNTVIMFADDTMVVGLISDDNEAQYITGAKLPAIQDLYTSRCHGKALILVRLQPPKSYLQLYGQRYQCTKSGTNRTLNSFYPQSIYS